MKRKRKRKQHDRTSPAGFRNGAVMSRLADAGAAILIADGEWTEDERCKSCAFRKGTVPNGCLQTQLDITKAVLEHKPFMCHVFKPGDVQPVCSGWFAAMQIAKKVPPSPCPWEFSPPDDK